MMQISTGQQLDVVRDNEGQLHLKLHSSDSRIALPHPRNLIRAIEQVLEDGQEHMHEHPDGFEFRHTHVLMAPEDTYADHEHEVLNHPGHTEQLNA